MHLIITNVDSQVIMLFLLQFYWVHTPRGYLSQGISNYSTYGHQYDDVLLTIVLCVLSLPLIHELFVIV